ncbi:MAG: hypothetical protein H0U25_10950 [Thermoleophilaceae bacterium]|nr:hypothetical protein [Thermoleophilaceae bacterium]
MVNRKTTTLIATAALLLALCSVVLATVQDSQAGKRLPGASVTPRKLGLLRLNKKKMFPASVIPKVRSAKNADRVGGRRARALVDRCSAETVDLGTFCLMSSTFPLDKDQVGKNNYFFATQACVELGGYLPTAAQLIGAAGRLKLSSTVNDSEVTALTDIDSTDGLKDRREMSASLTTTASGSRAAGSQGVSEESRGDPRAGEPDPAPQPANPSPETLQYVTVYDNRERGGFAGSKPVGQPESFRCAFNKAQGNAGELGG